jgi:ABC-type multidrug transport system fused ATPase/permease subunit
LPLQLSKIRRTDRVLVFEGKDAVQFGTHGELLVKEGPYRRLTGLLSRTERP